MAYDQRSLDDYVDVATRIADFRDRYPDGCLQPADLTQPWRLVQAQGWEPAAKGGEMVTQSFIVYVAAAYRTPGDPRPGIGAAWEIVPGRTPYTRGSELQNAETSAWGRAIIAVGASDAKAGIASREEVRNRREEREDGLPTNRDGSLSRSRTTDEQKAAAGVMTSQQQADHTALQPKGKESRPAERLTATPADDPFYDSMLLNTTYAPPVDEAVEDRPGTITRDQSRAMHAAFGKLGITERGNRLTATREILKLDHLASSADLSYRQAGDLLVALENRAKAGAK